MGNYNIVIEGVGPHHNRQPFDAEAHAARTVRNLVEDGHIIYHATIHAGGSCIELTVDGRAVSSNDGTVTPLVSPPALAEQLYESYCKSSGHKNFRGDPCPIWSELPAAIQQHWTAVALAARR